MRLDNITNSVDMSLSKLQEIVKVREAWHASVLRVVKSQTKFSDSHFRNWNTQDPKSQSTWPKIFNVLRAKLPPPPMYSDSSPESPGLTQSTLVAAEYEYVIQSWR